MIAVGVNFCQLEDEWRDMPRLMYTDIDDLRLILTLLVRPLLNNKITNKFTITLHEVNLTDLLDFHYYKLLAME